MESVDDFTKVESIFIRHRNVLLVKGQFTPIYTGYYLHLMENKLRHPESLDLTLKKFLAVLTLHLVARPWAETIAWTVNLRAPRVNFFATGSSTQEQVTGYVFTKDVKEFDRGLLFSQTSALGKEPQKSTVELINDDPCQWVETYYKQSEQRVAKAFELPNEEFVLLAAQPGADEEWLESININNVSDLLKKEDTKVLESRKFQFLCGCSTDRFLAPLQSYKDNLDELFLGEESISIQCPRCGKKHNITADLF